MKLLHIFLLHALCTITATQCADTKQETEIEPSAIYKKWTAEPFGVWERNGIPNHTAQPKDSRDYYHHTLDKTPKAISNICERVAGTKNTIGCIHWEKTNKKLSKKRQKELAITRSGPEFVRLIGGSKLLLTQKQNLKHNRGIISEEIKDLYQDEEFLKLIELNAIISPLAQLVYLKQKSNNNTVSEAKIKQQLALLENEIKTRREFIPQDIYQRFNNDPTLLKNIEVLLKTQKEQEILTEIQTNITASLPTLKESQDVYSKAVIRAWNAFNQQSNSELLHKKALEQKRMLLQKQNPKTSVAEITLTQEELAEFIFNEKCKALSSNISAQEVAILKSLGLHLPNVLQHTPQPITQPTRINIAKFVQDQYPLFENLTNTDAYIAQASLLLLQEALTAKCYKSPTATTEELLLTEKEVADSLGNALRMHAKLKAITPDSMLQKIEIEHPNLFPAPMVNETSKPTISPSNLNDNEFESLDEVSQGETTETITTSKGSEPLTKYLSSFIW